ncbi:MAG: hypothetical protein A2X49_03345 [Lentisphaerae bacterium GWF2_52_8]|nr:MAG: hypothetical protein A2X49_03345 [Lentisphaerae bacterium GWF2_52_8]
MNDNIPLIIAGIIALGGLVEAALAVFFYLKTRKDMDLCLKTEAEVVRIETEEGNEGTTLIYPVFRFKIGKAEHTVRNRYGRSPWKINAGDTVMVIYNTENPEEAEVLNPLVQWRMTMAMAASAVGSLILAPIVFFAMRH